MLFPAMSALIPAALLFLRVLLAGVFIKSGWSHAANPVERGESMGMSPDVTRVLGIVEVVAGLLVAFGIWPEVGALVIMAVMLGPIYKKVAVWNSGFWGEKNDGWYYDALYLNCAVVVLATGGGAWTLT